LTSPDGLLVLDKPVGRSSHDCVNAVRRLFGTRKVGHGGTLDPGARGVLVLCLGRATRLLEYVGGGDKVYRGEVVFGVETDSYDADGETVAACDASAVTGERVAAALPTLIGEVDQVPPMVSAKKVDGRKLYELHRQGQVVEVAPARVRIDRIDLLGFEPGVHPVADIEVGCGPGTYIRSIAHDLGAALGTGAHLRGLVRTRSGPYGLDDAVTLDVLDAEEPLARIRRLRAPAQAVAHLPTAVAFAEGAVRLSQGKLLRDEDLLGDVPDVAGPVAVVDEAGTLLAIAERRDEGLQPRKVLA
jgi:tRNA pseudouridine55 synthase